jgi:hypothetical protein
MKESMVMGKVDLNMCYTSLYDAYGVLQCNLTIFKLSPLLVLVFMLFIPHLSMWVPVEYGIFYLHNIKVTFIRIRLI